MRISDWSSDVCSSDLVDAFSRLADETQDTAELDPSDRDALLGASGPMFTNMWRLDCLGKAMPGSAPDMVNADGDDLVFHRIVFPLAKGVVGKSLIRRLNAANRKSVGEGKSV